ncbi:MAG TPA: alpha/beta fold hydrolase [Steroidobacteraceae bacterium]|nr:alpha/beta fold hydrolase [Steroidobacteraceae bacterium]
MTGFPLDTSFRPDRWLRGRHFQTILSSLPPRRSRVERRAIPVRAASVELLLQCGDGTVLQAFHASPAKRGREPGKKLAVLLHGWEGSADSTYVLSASQTLFEQGFEVVRLNLRDHGTTHHLNRELFHSCRLPEVVGAVRSLASQFANMPIVLAGFSLGGNFMLRVAADRETRDLPLQRVIAVSPVLDPAVTMTTLERGPSLYHSYFVRKWSRSLAKKQQAWPEHYDFEDLLRIRSLREMTRQLVLRHTEYPSMDDYLAGYAITGNRLTTLAAPATVLTSLDDPIIEPADLARLARSPHLDIVTTARGGHCGFLENLGGTNWVDSQLVKLLSRNPDS